MAQFNPAVLIPEIGAYDLCNPYCKMNHLASIIFTQRNTLFYIQVKDNSERNYASTGTARCAAALNYMGVVLVSFIDKIHRLSHFSSIFQFHFPKHLYLLPSEFRRASLYCTIVTQRPWFATLVVFCFIGANTRTLDRNMCRTRHRWEQSRLTIEVPFWPRCCSCSLFFFPILP